MKWFDRTFVFDLPAWMYPNVVERVRGTPARVEDLVRGLPADVVTRRDGERWSIQEHVGHLLDLEPLWKGRMDDFEADAARLRPADLSNQKTHDANHNAANMNGLLAAFRETRGVFVRQLDALEPSWIEKSATHPRLDQPMRILDHVFFVAEHDDHHLAEITRLERLLGVR